MVNESKTLPVNRRLPSAIILFLLIILQVLIIAVAFMGGFLYHEWKFGDLSLFSGTRFPLLAEAHDLLINNAYFELPEEKSLEYGMIRGMLQAYNEPHTVFVEPPQHELQTQELQGKFGGIGVRIERDAENLVYLYPIPDSPAQKAGVLDGDRLIKVEDFEIGPETRTDEIQAAVRGPVGEKITITIGHKPDYVPVEISMERAEVPIPSTTWNLAPEQPSIGILHIRVIADTTPDEVTKAIKDLQDKGAERFVIDVRNNGGGLVEAGVNTARLFLKNGQVIQQQYRGKPVKTFEVTTPGEFADLPIVVLVNKGTASAAEIFAGAIQGQGRAPIVGTNTYGKDTIQLVFRLSDGSSLHVTAAHWWIPGLAEKITGTGLTPDVPLEDGADDNQAQQAAIQTLLGLDE
jgi:carboxyl-terminal processing protease